MEEKDIIYITKEDESNFNSEVFFNRLLGNINDYFRSEYYKSHKKPPIFSFRQNCFIDPVTLPLIYNLGIFLKEYTKNPIYLIFSDSYGEISNDQYEFLFYSSFLSKIKENNIYTTDHHFAKSNFNKNKTVNSGNFIINAAITNDFEEKNFSIHDNHDLFISYIINKYILEPINKHLYFTNQKKLQYKSFSTYADLIVEVLGEIIANGIIHSEQKQCSAICHLRKDLRISVSDLGIGFYESLKLKSNFNFKIVVNEDSIPKSYVQGIEGIINGLFYSLTNKTRKGIIDIIILIINEKGYVKIFDKNVSIKITSRNETFKVISNYRIKILEGGQIDDTRIVNLFDKFKDELIRNYLHNRFYKDLQLYSYNFPGVYFEAKLPLWKM